MHFKSIYLTLTLTLIELILVSGCTGARMPVSTESSPPVTRTQVIRSATPAVTEISNAGDSLLATIVSLPTRTPPLTATPDSLAEGITEILQQTGLEDETVLWLGFADWINLLIALFIAAGGYLVGTGLIRWLLPRVVNRTKTTLDDQLLEISGNQIRWLIVILMLRLATARLNFIPDSLRALLSDLYFFLTLFFIIAILWRLIDLVVSQAKERAARSAVGYTDRIESLFRLSVWVLRLGVLVLAVSWTFSHFAINITGIGIFVAVLGLIIVLASRDALADFVSGVIILFDRPFRVGDRVELLSLNTAGDVVNIGIRATQILTIDNRMVIFPNSQIGKGMVVNYSYPDASLYDSIEVVVAYENDVEQIIQVLTEHIQQVEGVQQGRMVDVFLTGFTDYHMRFTLGWWLTSYRDIFVVRDRVSRTAIRTLRDAGVVLPYSKGDMNVQVKREEG